MRIAYFGSGEFGCPTLKHLFDTPDHEIVAVVTQPARPAGRGRKLVPTHIATLAEELSLPCVERAKVNEPGFLDQVRGWQPDVNLVIAFGQKIGPELIDLPARRTINLHGSLLPAYRGAAPINWAIINGEKEAGVTVIELTQVWDGGNMLGKASLTIEPTETAGELHDRLALLGPELIHDVLNQIEAGADAPLVQDDSLASRAPKLSKADGAIDWSRPAEQLRNQINGMWPWPGAHTTLVQQGQDKQLRLALGRATVVDAPSTATGIPGTLDADLNVICGAGTLQLLEVKPQGSRQMDFADFANGRRLQAGDRLINA